MAACPGSCNSAYRSAREAYEEALALYDPMDSRQERPAPPEIRPWEGGPVWCARCASRIRACLAELDDAGCLLAAQADGLRGESGEQRVSGSQDHASPSPAADDLDELLSMLTGWEDAYRDLQGWPSGARRGYLASAITTTIAWLTAHLDGILEGVLAEDFGAEILKWHRELCGKSKAGARRLRKPLRCPGCQLLSLTWTEGEEYVRCGNPDCSRLLRLAEYEAETERRAGEPAETAA